MLDPEFSRTDFVGDPTGRTAEKSELKLKTRRALLARRLRDNRRSSDLEVPSFVVQRWLAEMSAGVTDDMSRYPAG